MKTIAVALSALALIGLPSMPASGADLASDEQKTLYALGVALSQNLSAFALTEAELEIVKSGLTDGVLSRPLKVDMKAYGPKLEPMARARSAAAAETEKKSGDAYVQKAAKERGAKKTSSGAIVIPIKEGSGSSPNASDQVKVHYRGTLTDGTEFDSSIKRGQPASFPLNGVIKCWTEGLQQMKAGGKSRLVCPSSTAYGDRGSPPVIPPGATLVFEVELLEVAK
jgi:FKBP-type peptidyl-prolyl cis-trans isomerase FkpA/FKBP-type peptidyl-prolyl cis-trans isomerase FklB